MDRRGLTRQPTHSAQRSMGAPTPAGAGERRPDMADESTQATEDQTGAAAQSGERTFTQEEVNRLVGDARQKVRKQFEQK